jgi:hypothetical protein
MPLSSLLNFAHFIFIFQAKYFSGVFARSQLPFYVASSQISVNKNFFKSTGVYCRLRLNEVRIDLQSLFGLLYTAIYSFAETPQLGPPPPAFGQKYTRAILVSQDRRHLFVTP